MSGKVLTHHDLHEEVLWARVRREDKTVIPQLIELIQANPRYWWQAGRYLWSVEMTKALYQSIKNVADSLKGDHGTETDLEWILSERLMEIDQKSAERILLQEWDGLKYSPQFVHAALYFATPQLIPLAKEVIAQATEPTEFLKHVVIHMGGNTQGRKGITRIEQVKLLCDYADFLSELDIYALWKICNKQGWTELRKAHLDEKIAQGKNFRNRFGKNIDFSILDKMFESKQLVVNSFWFENHIREGKTQPELIDGLFDWLEKHRTLKGLGIVTDIFRGSARRADLERLQQFTENWPEAAELIEDLAFSIKLRTLD